MTVTAFLSEVQTIKDYEIVSLNRRDSLALAARLVNPTMPNKRLRAAKEKRDLAGIMSKTACTASQ